MENKIILFSLAILGTITCWTIVHFLIIKLPFWKYFIIEVLIVITKMLYEREKKRLSKTQN